MAQPPDDTSRDWRRQHRRGRSGRPAADAVPETTDANAADGEVAETEVASRTLFSFLEPALNTIGIYGAPLVIAGIVALIAGGALAAFVSSMRLYGFIALGFGAALILLVGLIFLSSVMAAFISRTGRYGVNSIIMLAAFLGIIIAVNFVSFGNNQRIDVTATNQFSLAERTEQLLDNLEQDIEVIAFYKLENAAPDLSSLNRQIKVRETFREFEAARGSRFSSEFVDPDVSPQRVSQYFGTTPIAFVNESLVVKVKDQDRLDVIQPQDPEYSHLEQDLVSSILLVTGREQKAVYFLSGHGERNISSRPDAAEGYSSVRAGLEQDNYRVESLNWPPAAENVAVPEDAALLVIARPTEELPEAHAQVLNRYLQGKDADGVDRQEAGRLIFLGEPDTPESFRAFLAAWGVILNNGYIRDLDGSLPGAGNEQILQVDTINPLELPGEIIANIPRSVLETLLEITTPQGNSLDLVLMPQAAPLQLIDDRSGLRQPIPLAYTSQPDCSVTDEGNLGNCSGGSYAIADPERIDPITDQGQVNADIPGPFTPVAYVRALGPIGAPPPSDPAQVTENQVVGMVVMGDSDFIANSFYNRGSGADLFLNSVNYLVGDFSLVSLRPKAITTRELNLDRNEFNFVRFSSWLFLPGLMALLAGLVWWVRR